MRKGDRRVAPEGEGTGPLSGLRVMQDVPYLRDLALIVALGAATEALLDYMLNAAAVARLHARDRRSCPSSRCSTPAWDGWRWPCR